MKPDFIKWLQKAFDIKIVRSSDRLTYLENTFELDANKNIRGLNLRDVDFGSLGVLYPIADTLVELTLTGANIDNIEAISSFPQLQFLDLSFNPIQTSTLPSLRALTKLKTLHLMGTNITDTAALGDIYALENLALSGSDVLDRVTGLEGLANLKYLEVDMTMIADLRKIQVSNSLRSLSAKSLVVKKIAGMERFIHLEALKLTASKISRLEGLGELKKLKRLDINSSNIKDIQGLENLVNLEILNLGDNRISEIKGLESLINLKQLNLKLNKLKKVEKLDGLVNLERIVLDANDIEEFDPGFMAHLVYPCEIAMAYNPLKSLNSDIPNNVKILW